MDNATVQTPPDPRQPHGPTPEKPRESLRGRVRHSRRQRRMIRRLAWASVAGWGAAIALGITLVLVLAGVI